MINLINNNRVGVQDRFHFVHKWVHSHTASLLYIKQSISLIFVKLSFKSCYIIYKSPYCSLLINTTPASTQPSHFQTQGKPQNCSGALQTTDIHANYLLLHGHVQLDIKYTLTGLVKSFII